MSQPRAIITSATREVRCWKAGVLALCLMTANAASAAWNGKYAAVDDARLRNAASEPGEWFAGGRDNEGTYYSPLDQINSSNVSRLGFAWEYRLGTYRGLEATPVVVDGVMYSSGQGGLVYALHARSGKPLWTFDPDNNPQAMRHACCDAVNRGVAIKNGLVYVGALDGRLFALDAATGKPRWSVDTLVNRKLPQAITGAPQLTKDLVIIGSGGGNVVRGYVSAYDLKTGEFRWRFYTVPVLGEKHPAPEMVRAAKTWDPKRDPRTLGGGTVWDGTAYDPDLDLIYFGTNGASPYDRRVRVSGGFDNLYASTIIALNATTGRMAWHYQTTPSGNWDYDATQKFILAELTLNGRARKVILQANKNGYFYVIDRKTGEVISAKPVMPVNWLKGMDRQFRPILDPRADYTTTGIKLVYPSAVGAHSWQPMSFNPKTGLVYIPVFDAPELISSPQGPLPVKAKDDDHFLGYWAIPTRNFDVRAADVKAAEAEYGKMPVFSPVDPKTGHSITRSVLKAWNPVTQKEAWVQQVSEDYESMEGGVMSTAGNLVFQGTSMGELRIYAADSGEPLHSISTGTAMMAAPSTYMVDGVQYVAIMAGFGADAVGSPLPPKSAPARYNNEGRILVFRLDGNPEVPRTPERVIPGPIPAPPTQVGSPAAIADGKKTFSHQCGRCHGGGLLPDLRRLEHGIADLDVFKQIVLEGVLATRGMARFDDVLTPRDVEQVHAYLVDQAQQRYARERANRPQQ